MNTKRERRERVGERRTGGARPSTGFGGCGTEGEEEGKGRSGGEVGELSPARPCGGGSAEAKRERLSPVKRRRVEKRREEEGRWLRREEGRRGSTLARRPNFRFSDKFC